MRILFAIFLLISPYCYAAEIACGEDYSYLVFEVDSHKILSEKKADRILYPASLTKVMTLYLTFEALQKGKLQLNQKLKISARGEEISKVNKVNTMNSREGDHITVRDAISAVIVKSFNEAAVTLAEAVAGDEWEFARLMNKKAQELGMINTSFRNASGLHEEGQYTTSYDLARLVIAIKKKFPTYYSFFAQKKFTYRGNEYETRNRVMQEYKGAEGMKTGFTNASGFNLISVAKRKGNRISSVVMNCSDSELRYKLTRQLLDDGFKSADKKNILTKKILSRFNYEALQQSRLRYYLGPAEEF
ncbi:MAG: D-alanyl-D-alanine carboxypeptidase [Proteobacteria bacterium]|nr:D-alanyl-D-alanine carboxypeptidase [Pseudomonadota bacterium]